MGSYDLNTLKSKSKSYHRNCEKDLLDIYEIKIDEYSVGVIHNYIIEKDLYEVYCFINTKGQIASGLNNKLFKKKIISQIYFHHLKRCIENKGLKFFFKS